jgi:hypothetical protein
VDAFGLPPEELTGALAPLADSQFFEQGFIDYDALARPGEIDLAPDAMYAEVAANHHLEQQSIAPWVIGDPRR